MLMQWAWAIWKHQNMAKVAKRSLLVEPDIKTTLRVQGGGLAFGSVYRWSGHVRVDFEVPAWSPAAGFFSPPLDILVSCMSAMLGFYSRLRGMPLVRA